MDNLYEVWLAEGREAAVGVRNEISSILNMSQVQISRMEKKILLKLREKFKV